VQHNAQWYPSWGPRSAGASEALAAAPRTGTQDDPRLLAPLLPAGPGTCGHPVLSIYQTEIIVYGTDLADYIDHDFAGRDSISADWTPPPMVPFWSDFL
jgi:hypothetical protein